jgi:hypothetical protein
LQVSFVFCCGGSEFKGVIICLGVFIAGILLSIVVSGLFERWRLPRVRRAFLADRLPMTDSDFLQQAKADTNDSDFFLAARLEMAEWCGIAPELIHPADTVESLFWLQWDGGFVDDFVAGLGQRTGVKYHCH